VLRHERPRRFESGTAASQRGSKTVDTCEGPFTICARGCSLKTGDREIGVVCAPSAVGPAGGDGELRARYPPTAIDSRHHPTPHPGRALRSNPTASVLPNPTFRRPTRCWLFMQSPPPPGHRTPAGSRRRRMIAGVARRGPWGGPCSKRLPAGKSEKRRPARRQRVTLSARCDRPVSQLRLFAQDRPFLRM